jgi:hypothetical protein
MLNLPTHTRTHNKLPRFSADISIDTNKTYQPNWAHAEDRQLHKPWENISLDPIIGTE